MLILEKKVLYYYGYKGLYNGETVDDIAKRKQLRYREAILDNMGSEELAANLFRITQIEAKLKRDKITSEKKANITVRKEFFILFFPLIRKKYFIELKALKNGVLLLLHELKLLFNIMPI